MVLCIDLGDDVGDDAVLIDNVGLTESAHADLPVVLLLSPGIVGLKDDFARVGDERKRQFIFGDELLMRRGAVLADSHHCIALADKPFVIVPQVAGFGRTAGCAVLGIEV